MSQLIFAVVVPRSNPYAVLINLIAGSIAEAGASQAGDLAFDLKIGYIVGAEAQVQLYGQIIGCFFGTFVTCGLYRMYTAVYKIPDKRFQIPVGYMAIIAARLVTGKGLPDHALEFVLGFGIFFIITTAIKIRYASYQWQNILPSGVAFAVGTSPLVTSVSGFRRRSDYSVHRHLRDSLLFTRPHDWRVDKLVLLLLSWRN